MYKILSNSHTGMKLNYSTVRGLVYANENSPRGEGIRACKRKQNVTRERKRDVIVYTCICGKRGICKIPLIRVTMSDSLKSSRLANHLVHQPLYILPPSHSHSISHPSSLILQLNFCFSFFLVYSIMKESMYVHGCVYVYIFMSWKYSEGQVKEGSNTDDR